MEYNLKKLVNSMYEHRKNCNFEKKSMRTSYRGLSVKASIGMSGSLSKIPWISFCAKGQTNKKGIYPVLLFYGTPEFIQGNINKTRVKKIVLAYGISATEKPNKLWGEAVSGAKTIKEAFNEWNYKTKDVIIKRYCSSYVFKVYDWTDELNYKQIQKDIDKLIDIYKNIIAKVETTTVYPTEPIAEPQANEPTEEVPVKSPVEILEELSTHVNETLENTLLETLKKMTPDSFERLIKELLIKMEVCKSEECIELTPYVKDDGVDVYVYDNVLKMNVSCCIQVKKYTDNSVGLNTVKELGGTLLEKNCKSGMVITTSQFTKGAADYNPSGYNIQKIDGNQLTRLLVSYGLGIKTKKIIVNTVDTDYLNSL